MNNKKLKKMLPYVIFVLGLLATLTIFLPALTLEGETYRGIDLVFGRELIEFDFLGEEVASAAVAMNVYAVVAYFAPIFAGVFTLILKRGNTFALAMFVLSGVMFFILNDYIEIEYEVLGSTNTVVPEWNNAFGVLVGAFAAIVAAIGEMLHISMTDKH